MVQTLTWLHLSDLHACKPRTGWDAKRVIDTLCTDLKKMQDQHGLRPDLIFFTGDAAYGHIGTDQGKSITEQFREAHDFFTNVRESFDPIVEQRNLFLVPGNHDVNRRKIGRSETQFLKSIRSLDEITNIFKDTENIDWQRIIERLEDYAYFLGTYGYDHLLTTREQLIYADAREVAGFRVGIAGFNSAWSAQGIGEEEMGRLWMAGRFQLEILLQKLPKNDFAIALLHHPYNWLHPQENSSFGRDLERDFAFVLHGHEHQSFVRADSFTGHTVISAGACHEWSESKNNGYNFVRLDFETGTGEVWLRQYDSTGGGWIPRIIANRTNDFGCWNLNHLKPWIEKLTIAPDQELSTIKAIKLSNSVTADKPVDRAKDYEMRYCKAVVDNLDYVQLFGIEVPRESKEYSLTVAYVSLNLTDEDAEIAESDIEEPPDEDLSIEQDILPAEQVFDHLCEKGRLLIRGAAGSGKTTLLRWVAVQSAKDEQDIEGNAPLERKIQSIKATDKAESELEALLPNSVGDWRDKIPFIVRLRDCPNGELPRPADFPLLLAKELPDPPADWMQNILNSGRALIMFDGADEVPVQARDETMRQIRQLMSAYPNNYYIVTTRPEAIERREFTGLGFVSARIEPMMRAERDTFIDRWHDAMEVRLRSWNEPVDLRPLAKRLKQRLDVTPAVARLTSNPLLCAVVCALHRARNENLPETPVDLCEKLCEMLLDRRDKERMKRDFQKQINEAYSGLEFRIRKGLLSKLAHYMVCAGVSAIPEAEADQQITEALESYNLTGTDAVAVRKALVERSGMLQESSEQRIEFLHNTLKEFLAAERFVNMGNTQILANHSEEASWQPVILFAVALPRDGSNFAVDLVQKILDKTPLKIDVQGRSKEARKEVARLRSQQFFFFRCYTNAYQCNEPNINQAFEQLSQELVPPQNMTDAVALASSGEAIIPYLKKQPRMKAQERAACIRTLSLIGGERADFALQEYLDDLTLTVTQELMNAIEDWSKIPYVKQYVEQYNQLPSIAYRIRDLDQLRNLNNLAHLELFGNQISDISKLNRFTNLVSLSVSGDKIQDISVLANLINLTHLVLSGSQIKDISALANLTNLTHLDLSIFQVDNISALARLINLTHLDFFTFWIKDISALANLTNLTKLRFSGNGISNISALSNLTKLSEISLSGREIDDISVLGSLTNLASLFLSDTAQVDDISMLASLHNLSKLYLVRNKIDDISVLANFSQLTHLCLADIDIRDISALASLNNLTELYISNTKVADISALANLPNLANLYLIGNQIDDVSILSNLSNLENLVIAESQVPDTSALSGIPNLKIAIAELENWN